MKPWYTSKTIWLGVITAMTGALPLYEDNLREAMTGDTASIILLCVGLLSVVLRTVTVTPIGK